MFNRFIALTSLLFSASYDGGRRQYHRTVENLAGGASRIKLRWLRFINETKRKFLAHWTRLKVRVMLLRIQSIILLRNFVSVWSDKVQKLSATLISLLAVACMYFWGYSPANVSDTNLAAAQIIGAALALILSLSIIPAQRAAELLSMPILKLYAKDYTLIGAFFVLVATTISSLFLATLSSDKGTHLRLAAQFILLGISFDALRWFYNRMLDLLIPQTAIGLVIRECDRRISFLGKTVERLVAVHSTIGANEQAKLMTRAAMFANSNVPAQLKGWTSHLEEFARRFISRKDTSAANEVIGALEAIGIRYADARRTSILLHVDPQFLLAGPISDISNVLNPIFDSIQVIQRDAIDQKNERIVSKCVHSISKMTSHAMTLTTERYGSQTAPLAFGACFYLDVIVQAAANARMVDAVRTGIDGLAALLFARKTGVDTAHMETQARQTLFILASAGFAQAAPIWTYPAIEAVLKGVKLELTQDGYRRPSVLEDMLSKLELIIPFEVLADVAGQRRMDVFPAYNYMGFEASVPFLLEAVAHRIKPEEKRTWRNPFSEFVEAADAVRHHYHKLSRIDLQSSVLRKWVAESLVAVVRVHVNLLIAPPTGSDAHLNTVETSLIQTVSWIPALFDPRQNFDESHTREVADGLVAYGVQALERNWIPVAQACVDAIRSIAPAAVFGAGRPYFVGDMLADIEVVAKAADDLGLRQFATQARQPLTRTADLTDDEWQALQDAVANRRGHLERDITQDTMSRIPSHSEGIRALILLRQRRNSSTA